MSQTAKVEAQKYSDAGKGFDVGNVAPSAKYLDLDGNVTDSEPERGKILVQEGDIVLPHVARALANDNSEPDNLNGADGVSIDPNSSAGTASTLEPEKASKATQPENA